MNTEKMLNDIEELRSLLGKNSRRLRPDLLKRIVLRLAAFSESCDECKQDMMEIGTSIEKIRGKNGLLENQNVRELTRIANTISVHLQKNHQLIPDGYYISLCLGLGLCFGTAIGQLLFKNMALGTGVGLCLGVGIGTALDEDAKKKGKMI